MYGYCSERGVGTDAYERYEDALDRYDASFPDYDALDRAEAMSPDEALDDALSRMSGAELKLVLALAQKHLAARK